MISPILPASKPFENPARILFQGNGWNTLTKSAGNRAIPFKVMTGKNNNKNIFLIGGVHGNETEGVQFMFDFCTEFALNNNESPFEHNLILIPVLNPDGLFNARRTNDNKVDLNRNMPTKDWTKEHTEEKFFPGIEAGSEPETKGLISLIEQYTPDYIVSFHSWKPLINYNGPAKKFAENIYNKLPMEIVDDIGYPTPGSLGTWAGFERKIPTITLEFERGLNLDQIYPISKEAILNSFTLL